MPPTAPPGIPGRSNLHLAPAPQASSLVIWSACNAGTTCARCPECGRPVWDSVTIADLRYAPADYVAHLSSAAELLRMCCNLTAALTGLLVLMFAASFVDADLTLLFFPFLGAFGIVVLLQAYVGLWLISTRDPRRHLQAPHAPEGRLRAGLVGSTLLLLAGFGLSCAGLGVAALLFALLGLAGLALLPALLMLHVRRIAAGLGRAEVGRQARDALVMTYLLTVPSVLYVLFLSAFFAIGPFIYLAAGIVAGFVALVIWLAMLLAWRRAFSGFALALRTATSCATANPAANPGDK